MGPSWTSAEAELMSVVKFHWSCPKTTNTKKPVIQACSDGGALAEIASLAGLKWKSSGAGGKGAVEQTQTMYPIIQLTMPVCFGTFDKHPMILCPQTTELSLYVTVTTDITSVDQHILKVCSQKLQFISSKCVLFHVSIPHHLSLTCWHNPVDVPMKFHTRRRQCSTVDNKNVATCCVTVYHLQGAIWLWWGHKAIHSTRC